MREDAVERGSAQANSTGRGALRPDPEHPEVFEGPEEHLRRRDGFKLTDDRGTRRDAMAEVEYCVICHERGKDSCSKGFAAKDPIAERHTYKKNPLGIALTGCPLEDRLTNSAAVNTSAWPFRVRYSYRPSSRFDSRSRAAGQRLP